MPMPATWRASSPKRLEGITRRPRAVDGDFAEALIHLLERDTELILPDMGQTSRVTETGEGFRRHPHSLCKRPGRSDSLHRPGNVFLHRAIRLLYRLDADVRPDQILHTRPELLDLVSRSLHLPRELGDFRGHAKFHYAHSSNMPTRPSAFGTDPLNPELQRRHP